MSLSASNKRGESRRTKANESESQDEDRPIMGGAMMSERTQDAMVTKTKSCPALDSKETANDAECQCT